MLMNDRGKGFYVLFTTADDVDQPVVPRMLMWGPSYLLFPQKISLHCSPDTFYFLFIKCFAKELSAIHSLLLPTLMPPSIAPNFAHLWGTDTGGDRSHRQITQPRWGSQPRVSRTGSADYYGLNEAGGWKGLIFQDWSAQIHGTTFHKPCHRWVPLILVWLCKYILHGNTQLFALKQFNLL